MPTIQFPVNPTLNQNYTAENSVRYQWDGVKWIGKGSGPQGATGFTGLTGSTGSSGVTGATGTYNIISSNTTLYVATTGNDSTGTGTSGSPWATPHKAMAYLRERLIADGVTVTVSVADGTYTFTSLLYLDHPQGDQITITGGTTTGTRPTTSLNGNNVRGNTAGTLAFNDALLNAYYNTKWQFNNCNGLECRSGSAVTVDKVLIRGNATSSFTGVITQYGGAIRLGETVAVHNFGNGIAVYHGGSIYCKSVTCTNTTDRGIVAVGAGTINAWGVVANNNNIGILSNFGGSILAYYSTASCNSNTGIYINYGGSIGCQYATANNNTIYGIVANFGGSIYAEVATAQSNGYAGIAAIYNSTIFCKTSTASSNGSLGIFVGSGGSIYAQDATALYNTTWNVHASRAGFIYIGGGNYAGSVSPALNTVGNGNAYING